MLIKVVFKNKKPLCGKAIFMKQVIRMMHLCGLIWLFLTYSACSKDEPIKNSEINNASKKLVQFSLTPEILDEYVRQASEEAAEAFENGFKGDEGKELTQTEKNRLRFFWYKKIKEVFDAESFYQILIPIVEKHLTLKEINEINKFYETPTGQKLVNLSVILEREGQAAGEQLGEKIADPDGQWMKSCLEELQREFPHWFPKPE